MTEQAGLSPEAILHGHDPSEVVDALRDRRASGGAPFDDGRKIGLVLEGGGMRAAGPAGGIVRLAQLGFGGVFDEVYATSAGVMNAAYFLSAQSEMGITIYHDDLVSRAFINPWRFWKIMDLDWVFRSVISDSKALSIDALRNSHSAMYLAVTEYDTGRRRLIDLKQSQTPALSSLKAAMAIPLLYNRTVSVDGVRCFDGGLLNPFPINDAIERGCTHILVLLSRNSGYVRAPGHRLMSGLFDWIFARGASVLRGMLARYPEVDRLHRDLALGRTPAPKRAAIATLCSPASCRLQRDTVNREFLTSSSQSYSDQVDAVFGDSASEDPHDM